MVKKNMKRSTHRKSMKKNNTRHKKTKNNKKSNKIMRGGDDGRYVLPLAYFGKGNQGYVDKFTPLTGAVSQGVIHSNGKFAGPNLYPTQNGGKCGCKKLRLTKKH